MGEAQSKPKFPQLEKHNQLTAEAITTLRFLKSTPGLFGGARIPDLPWPIYLIQQNNATYQGELADDVAQGLGIAHLRDGSFFYGHIDKSLPKGMGIYIYPDGSFYEGAFGNMTFNGYGCLSYRANLIKYIGNFMDGVPHGQGGEIYADGSSYLGEYQQGVKSGTGKYCWPNGDHYEGEFKNGVFHGFGVIYKKGSIYFEGNFMKGVKSGRGLITSESMKCEGEFENDELQGKAVIFWMKNEGQIKIIYDTNFINSKMKGSGYIYLIYSSKMERLAAEWNDNQLIYRGEPAKFENAEAYIAAMASRVSKH